MSNQDTYPTPDGVGDRLTKGMRELKDGMGVDRPDWTRFDTSAETAGFLAIDQVKQPE